MLICKCFSYQVPKEVGKVSAESSTFVEPIANRKDGIQAMFSRQTQAQSSPTKESSKKRKRNSSSSPSRSLTKSSSDLVEMNDQTPEKLKISAIGEDKEVLSSASGVRIISSTLAAFSACFQIVLTETAHQIASPTRSTKSPSKVKSCFL